MSTAQRCDLQMNIPTLRKLDAMLIVRATTIDPYIHTLCSIEPAEGLSEVTRKWLQYQECMNQVPKAAMAINPPIASFGLATAAEAYKNTKRPVQVGVRAVATCAGWVAGCPQPAPLAPLSTSG